MKTSRKRVLKLIGLLIVAVPFIFSLFQNCYFVNNKEHSIGSFGLAALLLGWSEAFVVWLANPILIFSIVFLWKEKINLSLIMASVALIASFSFFLQNSIMINEAGTEGKITGYDTGYWVWISSLILNFIVIFVFKWVNNTANKH